MNTSIVTMDLEYIEEARESMKRILVVIIALFIIAGGISFTDRYVVNATETTTQEETVFYKGLVNSKVNVRLGPGTEYDKLVVDDKQVQLNSGDEVVIIGEAKATSGIVWYNISFEYNGAEVEGFSTSSYIAKTDETITPTPLPTPSPTNTPTPKPEPTMTSVPTEIVKPIDDIKDEARVEKENDIKKYIILVLSAFGVFIVLIIVLKLVRRRKKNVNSDMSVKVDKIKQVKIEETEGKGKKRKPEIKKLSDDVPVVETSKEEVYLAGIEPDDSVYNEDYTSVDASGIRENASKEAEEKKALRAEIERLQEHDIVVHKYFGEGEVYDNSDVNLLEVRFENDVRFLNKDSLVSKRLLEVFDDEQQIYKRRSTGKKGGKKSSMNKKE